MRELLKNLRYNLSDVKNFGFGALARHFGRRRVNLRGIGPISLRPGQSDMLCIRQVFAGREYDLSFLPAVQRRIDAAYEQILSERNVPVIIDGGANIGAASLWYSRRYPAAAIVAVEPDDGNYSVLLENIESLANVLPVQAALGGEAGHVQVHSAALGWAVRTERSDKGVPVLTIDECVGRIARGRPFIVKIYIKGFEQDVFAGDLGWIARTPVIAIEPHDWMLPGRFTSRNFMRAMAADEFELFVLGENLIFVR